MTSQEPDAATALPLRADPERLVIRVGAPEPVSASLAVAWSPKWRAQLDAEPLPLRRSTEGLLEATLAAGDHAVALAFRRDAPGRLGAWVTAATVLALAASRISRRRHRSRRHGEAVPAVRAGRTLRPQMRSR